MQVLPPPGGASSAEVVQALNPFDALKLLDRLAAEGDYPSRIDLERPSDPEDARALEELFAERHPDVEIHWNGGGRFRRMLPHRRVRH